ncbi:MAG: hypothetical protein GC138_07600 [Gammaproteobacteria bacterium]|nr:hypothetical protein [Gammaproteobacteria bacterium]
MSVTSRVWAAISNIGKYSAVAVSGLSFASSVYAAPGVARDHHSRVDVSLGLEQYLWQEFDPNSGQRLLSEHGPRAVLNGLVEFDTAIRPLLVRVLGKAYSGVVNYDGQVQDTGNYVSSDTDYRGGQAEFQMGWAKPTASFKSLELYLGAGVEGWARNIADSTDSLGFAVGGFREDYRVYYGRIGLGFEEQGEFLDASFHVGALRPYTINEKVVSSGAELTLHPDGRWSPFADYRLSLRHNFIEFFYEGWRFDRSPTKNLVFQPKSEKDTYGVRFGREF